MREIYKRNPTEIVLFGLALWVALVSAFLPSSARAVGLQPQGINLGATSFYDGFGRNEEGFTYLAYLQWGHAETINGRSYLGKVQPDKPIQYVLDPTINAFVLINQLVYTLPYELFGDSAHAGINFMIPMILFDATSNPNPPSNLIQDNGFGLGDITFGPMLQFRPVMAFGRPFFTNRIEFNITAPTGKYDPSKDINQSSNFTSLIPSWAVTLLYLPHCELSARFSYLYNFKNLNPTLGYILRNQLENPPQIRYAQAGQAGWVNFAASFEFPETFHFGVNGYYFMQFNLDLWQMADGTSNPGDMSFNDYGKVTIFGIGPGAMWAIDEPNKVFANVYFQLIADNTAKNDFVINLRYIHSF
ncbi:MAG: transporter [Deltaproteobacteria bacterium]|nr:transporter [Deltaproteobacteria bacterium]